MLAIFVGQMAILAQSVVEPGLGESPIAIGGPPGDSQGRGGLLLVEAGEKAQLDELGTSGVHAGQLFQGVIERDQVLLAGLIGDGQAIQVDTLAAAAAFQAVLVASPIDQNPPHGLGSGGKKMSPTVPALDLLATDQAKVS